MLVAALLIYYNHDKSNTLTLKQQYQYIKLSMLSMIIEHVNFNITLLAVKFKHNWMKDPFAK